MTYVVCKSWIQFFYPTRSIQNSVYLILKNKGKKDDTYHFSNHLKRCLITKDINSIQIDDEILYIKDNVHKCEEYCITGRFK